MKSGVREQSCLSKDMEKENKRGVGGGGGIAFKA